MLSDIIDVHVHVATNRHKGCVASMAPVGEGLGNVTLWNLAVLALDGFEVVGQSVAGCLVAKLKEAKTVRRAVVLALDWVYRTNSDGESVRDDDNTYCAVSNEYVRSLAWENPRHVLFGASINPNRPDYVEEMNRCLGFRDGKASSENDGGPPPALIKWIPNSQGIEPDEVPDEFYDLLRQNHIPLLSHTGYEHTIPVPPGGQCMGNPKFLAKALSRGVDVIAAHCSAWLHDDEPMHWVAALGRLMGRADEQTGWGKLYGDLSAFRTSARPEGAKDAVKALRRPDRLVLGSDFPVPLMQWPCENPFDANLIGLEEDGFEGGFGTRATEVLNKDALAWAERSTLPPPSPTG